MSIDFTDGLSQVLLLLLLFSCCWSAFGIKQRLYAQSPSRFALVLLINILCYILLAALLGNFSLYRSVEGKLVLEHETSAQAPNSPYVTLLNQPEAVQAALSGYGLYRAQWAEVPPVALDFTPQPIATGAVSVQWPQAVVLGQPLSVSGLWRHPQNRGVDTLKLLDPAGDTVAQSRVRDGEHFVLKDVPKATGKVVYRFLALNDSAVLADEIVPLQVKTAPAARVLVVQAAPSFETNQMKQWASANGASLVVKTQVSKARFLTQKVNFDGQIPDDLQPQTLAQFDLMISDGEALSGFDQSQLEQLTQAIENGLGLLVLADKAVLQGKVKLELLASFGLETIAENIASASEALVTLRGIELGFPALAANFSQKAEQVFERAQNGRVLGVYKAHGSGNIAMSILTQRYRMRQNGLHQQYSRYWQQTFGLLARGRQDSRFVIETTSPTAELGFAQQYCVLSKHADITLYWQGVRTPLSQSSFSPYQYCTAIWPEQIGWHTLELKDIQGKRLDTLHRYTFSPQQWQSAKQYQKVTDTKAYIAGQKANAVNPIQLAKQLQPLPLWLYFVLLSVLASILWWERRL